MKYLGIARKEKDQILVPDALKELIKDDITRSWRLVVTFF